VRIDVLIIGGGGAGLWLLDELHRAGYRTLLVEDRAFGVGQTIASQGIVHGGLKYTLSGLLNESAKAIRDMPALWRECLLGQREPNLGRTDVLADACYLWRTESLTSKLGMVGARTGLRSAATLVAPADRPDVLASCPGDVFRVAEQVIDPAGFLAALADRHADRCVLVDPNAGIEFRTSHPGQVDVITLRHRESNSQVDLNAGTIVLTAGAGNAELRALAGLSADAMQRRPLHMALVRGRLPSLFGHCVDGAKTRVTITTVSQNAERTIWQLGGQVAEDGVEMSEDELIAHARRELSAAIPGLDLSTTQWATYRVDRAEPKTKGGRRPAGPELQRDGNVITAWPTKLALFPQLAKLVMNELQPPDPRAETDDGAVRDWPKPKVATPPWKACTSWR
jgi:glycerol-3-phosphate dehydrogenase